MVAATDEKWQSMDQDQRNARLSFERRFETDFPFQQECIKVTRQAFMTSDRD